MKAQVCPRVRIKLDKSFLHRHPFRHLHCFLSVRRLLECSENVRRSDLLAVISRKPVSGQYSVG